MMQHSRWWISTLLAIGLFAAYCSMVRAADEAWEELSEGISGRVAAFEGIDGAKIAGYIRKPAGGPPNRRFKETVLVRDSVLKELITVIGAKDDDRVRGLPIERGQKLPLLMEARGVTSTLGDRDAGDSFADAAHPPQ